MNIELELFGTAHGSVPLYISRPRNKGRGPAVVFCHGYTGNAIESGRLFWRVAEALQAKGIASYRFDYNGFGNSSGHSRDFTIGHGVEDALKVLDRMKSDDQTDPGRMGLMGMSMGGLIGATVLGQRKDLKAGVLLCAVDDFWMTSRGEERRNAKNQEEFWDGPWEFSRAFLKDGEGRKGSKALQSTQAKVLSIHGTKDEAVPLSHQGQYKDAALEANLDFSDMQVDGADHVFSSRETSSRVILAAGDFFERSL